MYILQKQGRFVIPRTELTYPAHTLKMNEKAAAALTDHVMPDFEDACPYEFKGDKSRAALVEALNTLDFGGKVIAIRPNNIRSKFFLGDVQAIVLGAPDLFHGIILPRPKHRRTSSTSRGCSMRSKNRLAGRHASRSRR